MKLRPAVLIALAAVAVGAACTPKAPPAPPAPQINQDSIDAAARARAEEAAAAERARLERERLERERLERERLERERAAAAAAAEARARAAMEAARAAFATAIYFDLDKSDLKTEARAMLDAKLPLLRANANVRIRIAGHADDRGSDEYNVALGQRRAAAAKRYLVDQGIAADRIDVVSFGEERPAAMGSGEESWAKNRRDEFEIIVGGETLRLP
jgi:peptidoglycan-associated lipoprotein